MKLPIILFFAWTAFAASLGSVVAADADDSPRLGIELRDGSLIIGQSLDDNITFHSSLFGDLKLQTKDIRAVDCVSTNSAILITTTGDKLAVSFVDSDLDIKTGFGKVELSVNSIRKFTIMGIAYEKQLPGLVALWSGDNRGKDSVGTNDATWTDVSYAEGKIGQAFVLDGDSSCAKIPFSPALDVGQGAGLTLSAWIKPSNVSGFHPIMEWNTGATIGVQLWIGQYPNSEGVLCANFVAANANGYTQVPSYPNALVTGSWQHVAVTYDKGGGTISLYINGNLVNQSFWANFNPLTTGTLWISARPTDHPGDWTYHKFFSGMMDQIAIYNRALSAAEIKSISIEDNGGQPMPPNPPAMEHPPIIEYDPPNQYNPPSIRTLPQHPPYGGF